MADDDILAELEAAGREFDKDAEIERILSVFRLDAYAVLDLQPGVPDSDIKKTYRTKSLLIHPDKTPNPKAPDAFDRLKKAQTELLDEKLRAKLDENIADARQLLMRKLKITADDEEVKSEQFAKDWREMTKHVIMDNEKRRIQQQKAAMREEGRQQRKEDEELAERKRKREYEVEWEKTRDSRIDSWRDFSARKNGAKAGVVKTGTAKPAGPKPPGPNGAAKKPKKMKTLG